MRARKLSDLGFFGPVKIRDFPQSVIGRVLPVRKQRQSCWLFPWVFASDPHDKRGRSEGQWCFYRALFDISVSIWWCHSDRKHRMERKKEPLSSTCVCVYRGYWELDVYPCNHYILWLPAHCTTRCSATNADQPWDVDGAVKKLNFKKESLTIFIRLG